MFIDSNIKNIFFTSDTHFGHKNVIKYCNRPYLDVDDMNSSMVDNWNSLVGINDTVFHVGDFAFIKDQDKLKKLILSLNGRICLIPGNHDHLENYRNLGVSGKLDILPQLHEVDVQVEDEKIKFVLFHYAMRTWNKSHYGAIHLYGHSHGNLADDPNSLSMDVGVDSNNYFPWKLDDVLVKMYNKSFKPLDRHRGNP